MSSWDILLVADCVVIIVLIVPSGNNVAFRSEDHTSVCRQGLQRSINFKTQDFLT